MPSPRHSTVNVTPAADMGAESSFLIRLKVVEVELRMPVLSVSRLAGRTLPWFSRLCRWSLCKQTEVDNRLYKVGQVFRALRRNL